ncbi:MAG: DUF3426 domain-containing protein [Marinobacter sp.]
MADTSSLLTRCPHCDTRFRVTGEQLNVANGKVRCGNCMEVFDARGHADTPPTGDSPAAKDGKQESFSATDPEDDIIFQDNPEEDATEGAYAGRNLGFSDDELSDSFRTDSGLDPARDDDEDGTGDVDESWAEAMLQEELPDTPPGPSHPPRTGQTPGPRPTNSAAATQPQRQTPPAGPSSPAAGAPYSMDDLEITEITAAPPPDDAPAGHGHRRGTSGGGGFPPLDDVSPYEQLSREPVAVRSGSGRRLRGWLWTLVIVALLGGLISQAAWFQFDRLSAIPELRPWYEKACEYAGCELEPLIALDRIQSRKLVVRTDPDNRNALLVDAVIINQAEFEQPFPAIALTFSNLNGDVVAQSIFPPEDYLEGEGKELESMPPGTPVRIAISIRDPGRDAVNYNLRFVNRRDDS